MKVDLLNTVQRLVGGKNSPMTKYEAVRAKIVDSCDELKHPRIKIFYKEDYVRYEHKAIKVPSNIMFWLENLPNLGWEVGEIETNEWSGEVRIHEKVTVRLSHVLRAIGGQTKDFVHLITQSDGDSFKIYLKDRDASWIVDKDDLSLQSSETIDFLFNILCE